MNKIIEFSVKHPWTTLLITAFIAFAGAVAFKNLAIDAVPDITNVQVQVNVGMNGLAPEELERTVTAPLETAMGGIPGITQVRSLTRLGLSQVTIIFNDDVDIYRARQLVSERLQSAIENLPPGAKPELGPVTTGLGEIVHYTIESDDPLLQNLSDLKTIQEWVVKPRLLTVKGVAEINTIGGASKQYHVHPIPQKMASFGVHFNDLAEALKNSNQNVGGGYVQRDTEQFTVQAVGMLKSVSEILEVPVKKLESFRTVKVSDIAEVTIGKAQTFGAASVNGKDAVLGTAMMLLGENSRTVSEAVVNKIKEINEGLPKGVRIQILYDRSVLVNATLGTVEHNLIVGATLVIVILLFLVGNLRAAIITALTIPLTLLTTFLVMKYMGISGNLMSLGALDFGIIVDGTVIVIDNCVRLLHERAHHWKRALTLEEVKQTIVDATIEIRSAAGFGQLIIVVVFLPIFGLAGIEGKMFRPMAMTFSAAILIALIMSFTTTPALASLVFKGNEDEKEPRIMQWIRLKYEQTMYWAFTHWKKILGVAIGSVIVGFGIFFSIGGEFLPQLNEGSLVLQIVRPLSISLETSQQQQIQCEKIIKEFPEVDLVFSRLGTAEVATDPMGVNEGDLFISFKENLGRNFDKADFTRILIKRLESEIPNQQVLASQPIQMRFNDLLGGTRADLSVKIYGDDLKKLGEIAKQITTIAQSVPGASDVTAEQLGEAPILRIFPKTSVLKSLGMSVLEVLDTVEISLAGSSVGWIYEGFKKFPLVVRLEDDLRRDLNAISDLPVGLNTSGSLKLKEVADLKFMSSEQVFFREMGKRRTAVLINLRDRDTQSFVKEAKALVAQKVILPQGYFLEWGGNFKNMEEARSRLILLTPIALILVIMMVFAAFQSGSQTAIVLACVPLSLSGGIISLVLNGLNFSITAAIGFIALLGISVLNGVVLVNVFNEMKNLKVKGEQIVLQGTLLRLRPVLMTALVDIFGFLPMMLSKGMGAEVQKPLAAVVIGGVISSTVLTLVVLPIVYWKFELKAEALKEKEAAV
ncbi:MAG: efflux RND transporter permease subunit [Bdellovibrio sp.]